MRFRGKTIRHNIEIAGLSDKKVFRQNFDEKVALDKKSEKSFD